MTAIYLATVSAILLVMNGGCSGNNRNDQATEAPFDAQLGQVKIHVPKDPAYARGVFLRAGPPTAFVAFDLCRRRLGKMMSAPCEAVTSDDMNREGIRIFLRAPNTSTRYSLIKERSASDPPRRLPLQSLALQPDALRVGAPGEGYQLSRLQFSFSQPLSTTERGWPLAACGLHPSGTSVACALGFRIRDMSVEAHWITSRTALPDQREIWTMASSIDGIIRNLIINKL